MRTHVEDAAFLWSQWTAQRESHAVDRSHTLAQERRLKANLAALTLGPELALLFIEQELDSYGYSGEVFVAAWFAIKTGDAERLGDLAKRVRGSNVAAGLLGAVEWSDESVVRSALPAWANSSDDFFHQMTIATCAAFSIDPRSRLRDWLASDAPNVRAAAMKLAGDLGKTEYLREICAALDASEPVVGTRALHAALLLGSSEAISDRLIAHAATDDPLAERSALLLILAAGDKLGRSRIKSIWDAGAHARAVRLAGLIEGDDVTRWLVRQMSDSRLVVAAGLAFVDRFALEADATDLFTRDLGELDAEVAASIGDESDDPYPIVGRVKDWLSGKSRRDFTNFQSNRLRMIACFRSALERPGASLPNWCTPVRSSK